MRAGEDAALFVSPLVAGNTAGDSGSGIRRHSSYAGNAPTSAPGMSLDSSSGIRRHSSYDGRNHDTPINTFGRVFDSDGGVRSGSGSGSPGGALSGSVVQRQTSFHSGSHTGGSAGGVGELARSELARSVPLPPPTGGVSYSSIPGPGSLQLDAAGTVPGAVPDRNSFGKNGTPPGYFVGNGSASGGAAGIVSNGRRGSGVVSGGGGVGGGAVSGGVGGAAVSSGFVGGAAVSSGFVGGGRVAAAGAGGVCGGGGGGGAAGSAASELAGYTAQEQQLWAALSEGPEVGDAEDVEVGGPGRVARSEACSSRSSFCTRMTGSWLDVVHGSGLVLELVLVVCFLAVVSERRFLTLRPLHSGAPSSTSLRSEYLFCRRSSPPIEHTGSP